MAHFLPDGHVPSATVRLGTTSDLKFLDHLQKRFAHQLGYLPLVALEKRLSTGDVWIGFENGSPAGYILGRSPYNRRPELAIIYQSAIEYDARRKLVGTLLVEAWARSLPPSVNQLVCWCAQDIDANLFWSGLDFLPLAYRAGSTTKQRIHIYWNRPLNPDLDELWCPDATANGLMRGPREVRLLQPGQDWHDKISIDWNTLDATLAEVKSAAIARANVKHATRQARQQAQSADKLAELQLQFSARCLGHNSIIVGGRPRPI